MKPTVSIVTPCRNSGKFLQDCIKSVLAQDYPYVEHLIQDGKSKDNTIKILKQYSEPRFTKRIKWLSEPDQGQSDGLNKALKRATGDIILVLNADDLLLPDACSWGVAQLEKNKKYAVVYGDEYIIDEKGEIIAIYIGKPNYTYERLFCVELVPPAQASFIRRSSLEKVGFGADPNLSTCPDFEMWVRLGAKFPFKHEFGIICKYRHHPDSEGRRPEMVDKMVEAKLSVINKILTDPKTPPKIKRLKWRAYAGLYHWAANSARGVEATQKELSYLSKSLFYRPQLHKIIRLIRLMLNHIPNLIKSSLI